MYRVEEIDSLEKLAGYRRPWSDLFAATSGASFFHTHEWLTSYWRHFGQQHQWRILVVHEGTTPVGILPLVVTREKTRVGHVRTLTYPLQDWGSFYGPVGPQPTATLLAGLRHISQTRADWDLLDLRFIDPLADEGRTARAMQQARFSPWTGPWAELAMVDMHGDWDAYFAARPAKFRGNLRRLERRLLALGDMRYERVRPAGAATGDGDPRWHAFEEIIALAERTWQGGSTNGTTLSHASIQPFIRDTHLHAAALGMLDTNLVWHGPKLIAYAYNYQHQGYVYGLRNGYDPEYAQAGVGGVMTMWMLQDSFTRGDRLFDLGAGYLDIKQGWATRTIASQRSTHYRLLQPRAQLLRLKRWWNEPLESTGNGVVQNARCKVKNAK